MEYSYIFRSAKIKRNFLESAGFKSSDNQNYFKQTLISNGAFKADIYLSLENQTLSVQLFDTATDEKYALFDMPNVHGAFIGALREEVQSLVDDIKERCFESKDLKEDYILYLKKRFSVQPDFPWPETPEACVFRCPNTKWFALLMKIKYRQLGLRSEESVFVVNLKADCDEIPRLVDNKSIFPSWHMNKKHWITILLTAVTDFEKLCKLTEKSYSLVYNCSAGKKSK